MSTNLELKNILWHLNVRREVVGRVTGWRPGDIDDTLQKREYHVVVDQLVHRQIFCLLQNKKQQMHVISKNEYL